MNYFFGQYRQVDCTHVFRPKRRKNNYRPGKPPGYISPGHLHRVHKSTIGNRQKHTLSASKEKRGLAKSNVSNHFQNHFLKWLLRPPLDLKRFECFAFPENVFNFDTQKSAKKLKNFIFKHSGHLFLATTQLQNQFLILDYYPTLDLNVFKGFARLSQKTASTLLFRHFQKKDICHFQMLRTFAIHLKLA